MGINVVVQRFPVSPERRERTDERYINYIVKVRMEYIVRGILVCLAVAFLTTPIVAFSMLHGKKEMQFLVAFLFMVLFSTSVSVLTSVHRHQFFSIGALVMTLPNDPMTTYLLNCNS